MLVRNEEERSQSHRCQNLCIAISMGTVVGDNADNAASEPVSPNRQHDPGLLLQARRDSARASADPTEAAARGDLETVADLNGSRSRGVM